LRHFLDTNVLVYAQQHGSKGDVARGLLAEGGATSVQVLNEFTNVLQRKFSLTWPETESILADIGRVFPGPRPLTRETHASAVVLCRDIGCSFYNGLILASALDAKCDEVLSEDLQDGRRVGSLVIRNPFI
jgi:predicted nucleic acid-binding protein